MSGHGNQDEYPPMAELIARRNAIRDKWSESEERRRRGLRFEQYELPVVADSVFVGDDYK